MDLTKKPQRDRKLGEPAQAKLEGRHLVVDLGDRVATFDVEVGDSCFHHVGEGGLGALDLAGPGRLVAEVPARSTAARWVKVLLQLVAAPWMCAWAAGSWPTGVTSSMRVVVTSSPRLAVAPSPSRA